MEHLQRFFPQILKYLDFTNLSPFLISERLLTLSDLQKLEKCGDTREEQIGLLISILQRKGKNVYCLFYKALERSVATDDLSCHLGHVELLEILPKVREERRVSECIQYPVMVEEESLSTRLSQSMTDQCAVRDSDKMKCTIGSPVLCSTINEKRRESLSFGLSQSYDSKISYSPISPSAATAHTVTGSPVLCSTTKEKRRESLSQSLNSKMTYSPPTTAHTVAHQPTELYTSMKKIQKEEDLTDSGVLASYEEEYTKNGDIVENDSPRYIRKGLHEASSPLFKPKPQHFHIMNETLSVLVSNWEQVQEEITSLSERNNELLQLMNVMSKEQNEIQFSMKNCLKLVTDPLKYPKSETIQKILAQNTTTSQHCPNTVAILLIFPSSDGLRNGERLHTSAMIISALFGLPIALPTLKFRQTVQLMLFNNDVLEVTIIDTLTPIISFKRQPDIVIGLTYTCISLALAPPMEEITTWSHNHNLSEITVYLSLDHHENIPSVNNLSTCNDSTCTVEKAISIQQASCHTCLNDSLACNMHISSTCTCIVHVLPIHRHLVCLRYHLSVLFAHVVERGCASLQHTLVGCNQGRLKKSCNVSVRDLLSVQDEITLFELDLYCH